MEEALIKYHKPNIWPLLKWRFPGIEWKDITVTFGGTIYTQRKLTRDLVEHEMVHIRQQKKYGKWRFLIRYFFSVKFRLAMEIEAYKAQYAWFKLNAGYGERIIALRNLAKFLSGPMYNHMITKEKAIAILRG